MCMKDADIKVVGLSNAKPKGKTNWKVMGAIIGIVVLALGVTAGIILVQQQQNIEEKAACTASCISGASQITNCYQTADTDGEVSLCNAAGRVQVCGQNASNAKQFCCPVANGAWTTDLTRCSVTTPTATATATATATSTATSSSSAIATSTSTTKASATATSTTKATATSTTKASATATSVPLPVTGVEWPTMLGVGFGVIMILLSMSLAL